LRNVVYTAIYAMSNIFIMFVIKNFMEVFFAERKGKFLFVLAYVSYPVLVTSVCFLFKTPIANVAANILSLMLITLVYTSSAKKN
jgi:hypothetical protein